MIFFKLHVSPNTYHNCHNAKKKVTRDSMYIFRNELELVCLVIGWGGGVSDYLFGVGGGIE